MDNCIEWVTICYSQRILFDLKTNDIFICDFFFFLLTFVYSIKYKKKKLKPNHIRIKNRFYYSILVLIFEHLSNFYCIKIYNDHKSLIKNNIITEFYTLDIQKKRNIVIINYINRFKNFEHNILLFINCYLDFFSFIDMKELITLTEIIFDE